MPHRHVQLKGTIPNLQFSSFLSTVMTPADEYHRIVDDFVLAL